jgi:hypothetical protein
VSSEFEAMAKNDGNKLVNAAHHRCQRSLPRRSCYGQEMARHAPWACAAQMLLAVGCLLLLAAPSCGLHCAAPSSLAPAPSDATPSQPLSYHHRVWAANRLRGGSGRSVIPTFNVCAACCASGPGVHPVQREHLNSMHASDCAAGPGPASVVCPPPPPCHSLKWRLHAGAHELPPLPEGWEERVHTDGRGRP